MMRLLYTCHQRKRNKMTNLSKEILEARRSSITGTDASIILGVNPYESVIDLWQRKMGLLPEKDLSSNPMVLAGRYLEDAVTKMFIDRTGKTVFKPGDMIFSSKYKFMSGNIDGKLPDENAIFEAKTARTDKGWGEQGVNVIPKHYLCQVAHYMALTDASHAYVAVLISGFDFRHYVIKRNEALESKLIEHEERFYVENMIKGEMPEPRNMQDVIIKYQNATLKAPVDATDEIKHACKLMAEYKKTIKELETNYEKYKNMVGKFMGQNESLVTTHGDILATWKPTKGINKFDVKAFREENAELYEKYLKLQDGSRRFLLKGSKDDGI